MVDDSYFKYILMGNHQLHTYITISCIWESDEIIHIYIEVIIENIKTSMIPNLYHQIHHGVWFDNAYIW
jgi:hypothetical protein